MRFCVGIYRLVALVLCSSSLLAPAFAAESKDNEAEPFTKYERYSATYEVNADGTYVEHYEWAVRVLGDEGVASASSTSITYTERLHAIEVLEAYTLKPDGRRIDAPPNNYQVLQAGTARGEAAATCADHKSMTVVFAEVAVGDLVVFSYRRVQQEALFPGHFSLALPLSRDELYDDVRIRLSAPESMVLYVFSRDVGGEEIEHARGRREWLWSFRNAKRAKPDHSELSWSDTGPVILVSTFGDYQALGTAYELRARPKAAVTERVRALAAELTSGTDTPRTQVNALYDWVSKNIRYAGNCLGASSVVPHDVDRILTSKMGDCKDHAALLQALMDAKDIPSTLALVRIGGSSRLPVLPVAAAVNHVMNYVPSLDLFVDATSKNTPFGTQPRSTSNRPVVLTGPPYGIRKTPSIDDRTNWVRVKRKLQSRPDTSADGGSEPDAGG
jgi:transglutaminase-like putative cysteine protease